ncbi:unnamed protein product [Parajaminaea phylloscopi]
MGVSNGRTASWSADDSDLDEDDSPSLAQREETPAPLPPLCSDSWLRRVLFLGTGTSGQVPAIHCLSGATGQQSSGRPPRISCDACRDAIRPGSKNRRGCCSVALIGSHFSTTRNGAVTGSRNGKGKQVSSSEDEMVIIDAGPTFYSAAVSHFRRNRVPPCIAGVVLTHGHADAMLGLDSLRAWTLGGVLQDYIDVYLTQETLDVAKSAFPYLVDTSKATGGGGVGALRWNIIDGVSPFFVGRNKIKITPLPVEHGFVSRGGAPFPTLGFRVDSFSYISDCHRVPAETAQLVAGSECVVIDSLMPRRHASHFSVSQAVSFLLSLPADTKTSPDSREQSAPGPTLGILTDLTHRLEHHALQSDLDQFTQDLRTWSRAQPDVWARADAERRRGEGSGPRWWRPVWNEDEAERDEGRIMLNPNRLGEGVQHGRGAAMDPADRTSLSSPHVPEIKVAWDGMVLHFEPRPPVAVK